MSFRDELLISGILGETGEPGLYHRSGLFEDVVSGVERYFRSLNPVDNIRWTMSPVTTTQALVDTDYVDSFPQLMALLDGFNGDARQARVLAESAHAGADWSGYLGTTNLALRPVACHGLYPTLSGREVPDGGAQFEVSATCFRREPSDDPARMQSFRMLEFVMVGTPSECRVFRDEWLHRALAAHRALGLDVSSQVANDPFFGRASQMLSQGQIEKELKYEVMALIASEEPNAISSANYHEDHFGNSFNITTPSGVAHSACFGVGLERTTLALFRRHGLRVSHWPSGIMDLLGI
ncbi:MAG: hypothetical protein KGR42_09060 [Acidobacteria bacterium]|jgi:seryl-tRNA synthetase|nr:hypothetical protein [Acidobacteriota bacterium]